MELIEWILQDENINKAGSSRACPKMSVNKNPMVAN